MIVAVRHGQTEWALKRLHTGRTDVPLTDEGRSEASRLHRPLSARRFEAVLASPLSRAWDTGSLAGLSPVADVDLVEWDYGEYDGITTEDVRRDRPDWLLWRDCCPGGESPADVAARADRVEQPYEFGAHLQLGTATVSEPRAPRAPCHHGVSAEARARPSARRTTSVREERLPARGACRRWSSSGGRPNSTRLGRARRSVEFGGGFAPEVDLSSRAAAFGRVGPRQPPRPTADA